MIGRMNGFILQLSVGNIDKLFEDLNINRNKPLIGLATNVIWDAQQIFPQTF